LPVLIFDERSSETIELDWRGSQTEFLARLEHTASQLDEQYQEQYQDQSEGRPQTVAPILRMRRGPGRPKLGVVAREVTLLPRHWDWLATQTGGASVALRKLVEIARLASEEKDRVRHAREVGYKFMSTMAGHEVGFEEACRALFAGNRSAFDAQTVLWPKDVRTHLGFLLGEAF
jgi:uncharacterized protein